MRVIIILICLMISVSSCKKNAAANNSERKLQNKNRGITEESFSCDKGQNDVEYALKHFEEIKKCIEDSDSYLSGLLINIQSEVNNDNASSLKLLDSLYSIVDGADAEIYIDVIFTIFKADSKEVIRYLCVEQPTNMEKACVDAVTFYRNNEVISNEEIQEIFQGIDSYHEIDSCKGRIMSEILKIAVHRVKDPDGYTNLRKGKGIDSPVIARVKNKEKVNVLNDSGKWWEVQYGKSKGYIHKSRLVKE